MTMFEQEASASIQAICPGVRDIRNRVSERADILIRQWQEIEDALKILSCDLDVANSEQTEQLQVKLQAVMQHFLTMEGHLQNQCRAIVSAASKKPLSCPYRSGEDGSREMATQVMTHVLVWTDFLRALAFESGSVQRYGSTLSLVLLQIQSADGEVGKDHKRPHGDETTEFITALLPVMRRCDIIGRLNDDCFVLLFPHTTSQQTAIAISRFEQLAQFTSGNKTHDASSSAGVASVINYHFSSTEYRPEETPVNTLKRLIIQTSSEPTSDRKARLLAPDTV